MSLTTRLKGMIWNLAYGSGLLGLLEKMKTASDYKGLIFYYHRVHPNPGWDPLGLTVLPSLLHKQMSLFKKKMPVVSLKEFVNDQRHSSLISSQTPRGVITFDDGYRDVWVYARPILKEFSITPTFFVCTHPLFRQAPLFYDRLIPYVQGETRKALIVRELDGVNRSFQLQTLKGKDFFVKEATRFLMGSSQKDQETFLNQFGGHQNGDVIQRAAKDLYLSPAEVKKAHAEGVDIGSHTATHPNLRLLPREKWDEEIKGSKEELEALLGAGVEFFSYPAGHYSPEIGAYVRDVGYLGALTTGKRAIFNSTGDRFALPRISPEGITTLGKFYAQVAGIRPDWFK